MQTPLTTHHLPALNSLHSRVSAYLHTDSTRTCCRCHNVLVNRRPAIVPPLSVAASPLQHCIPGTSYSLLHTYIRTYIHVQRPRPGAAEKCLPLHPCLTATSHAARLSTLALKRHSPSNSVRPPRHLAASPYLSFAQRTVAPRC